MSRLALIENSIVTNVILCDTAWAEEHVELAEDSPVSKGWTYNGDTFEAPVKIIETHLKSFDSKDLLNTFTPQEAILAQISSVPSVAAQYKLLTDRTKIITFDDPGYLQALEDFLEASVISQERHDDLTNGIPL